MDSEGMNIWLSFWRSDISTYLPSFCDSDTPLTGIITTDASGGSSAAEADPPATIINPGELAAEKSKPQKSMNAYPSDP